MNPQEKAKRDRRRLKVARGVAALTQLSDGRYDITKVTPLHQLPEDDQRDMLGIADAAIMVWDGLHERL